jgi:hypothetical protein
LSDAPEVLEGLSTPALDIEVSAAHFERFAASPTLVFGARITERANRPIYTIALRCQINVDPARRRYDAASRVRLSEQFGEPERWGATTKSFMWARVDVLVPSFEGATDFDITVPCSYDLEITATRYLRGLSDGAVPMSFHLSGSVFYKSSTGELRITQVPWDMDVRYELPLSVWNDMMEHHYPNSGWVRFERKTLDRLLQYKAERGMTSLDACLIGLLENDGIEEENSPVRIKGAGRPGGDDVP